MPEYLSPGVYVEEVSSGIKPIEGVGTSTGAFVGRAVKGPVNSATLITNRSQFSTVFGGPHQDYHLAYAVQHFFAEGGTRCYIVRAFNHSTSNPDDDRAQIELNAGAVPALRVLALNEGSWGEKISVEIGDPDFDPDDPTNTDGKFSLKVWLEGESEAVETYGQLSMKEFTDDGLPNTFHVEAQINDVSKYIEVDDLSTDPSIVDPPDNTPTPTALSNGSDGLALAASDFIGTESEADGLHAFDVVDDINIVAIPDLVVTGISSADARTATLAGISYCENRGDCFFVADPPRGLSPQDVLNYKRGTGAFSGNAFNSTYAALYYPWIYVSDSLTGKTKLFPPSGAVAGSYSSTDVNRGVHKAPAGVENGYLNTAANVERIVTKGEHDTLNPNGINVIRKFPEAGIVIWGARTVSTDPEWKYVNIRRLFMFLEESIEEGTQWVVFEPNDQVLWKRIVRNISAFLRIQWLEGKLVGNTSDQAFYVKCDEETNPQESIDLGRVITEIGVAPSKPAEFVIFRISQFAGGSRVEE